MQVYEFDLVVDGIDLDRDERTIAELETRVDDLTFAMTGPNLTVAVERSAPSLGAAINSAVNDIESIAGVRVARVLPDSHVSVAEIASRTGRSRQSVHQLIRGDRGPGGFPQATFGSGRSALWQWSEVTAWFERAGMESGGGHPKSDVIEAINSVLGARRVLSRLSHDDQLAIRSLVA